MADAVYYKGETFNLRVKIKLEEPDTGETLDPTDYTGKIALVTEATLLDEESSEWEDATIVAGESSTELVVKLDCGPGQDIDPGRGVYAAWGWAIPTIPSGLTESPLRRSSGKVTVR